MRTNWLCERGARIGPEQSSTGNRVGPRVSGNERLPGVVVLARERLLRKPGDAGHRIYIGVVYLVIITASPNLEVHKLDELPEQWRRFKLAWFCKELSSHNSGALIRILNAQKKWIRQEDTKNFDGQPDSIVRQGIENMVRSYIEKPNSIILAISPTNQDLVTSDAIKISREVDPTGKRTLEVAG